MTKNKARLKVTQVRSTIGTKPNQRETLRSLHAAGAPLRTPERTG